MFSNRLRVCVYGMTMCSPIDDFRYLMGEIQETHVECIALCIFFTVSMFMICGTGLVILYYGSFENH